MKLGIEREKIGDILVTETGCDILLCSDIANSLLTLLPSLRLDSIVSELAHTSRNKAIEIINSERVLVNFELALKPSKLLNYGDIITIRGKGRFEINNLKSTSKSGKLIIKASKYI